MRAFILSFILLTTVLSYGQKQIQVKNQKFEVVGVIDGNPIHKETRNLMVKLNYETGDMEMGVDLKNIRLITDEQLERTEDADDLYKITGRLPLNDILYNKQTDQNYKLELNLENNGKVSPQLFNCDIKNYVGSGSGFRQFIMTTDADLPDDSEELYGLEPRVKIIISFQMYVIGG